MQYTATVDRIVWRGDSGWAILKVKTDEGEQGTVVGMISHLEPGETVTFSGEWEKSRKWGPQFKARSCEVTTPASAIGMTRYLATMTACGPVRAKSIVDRFGEESLGIVWGDIDALATIPGIGRKTAKEIQACALGRKSEAGAMVELQQLRCPPGLIPRLIREWGSEAANEVRANPYELIRRFDGVGFKIADAIALTAGLSISSQARIEAGLLHALRESIRDGHSYLPRAELFQRACKLLALTRAKVEEGLAPLENDSLLVIDGEAIYLGAYHRAEHHVSARILGLLRADARTEPGEVDYTILPFDLDPVQAQAVEAATLEKILVLTGGPGTGKTTITRVLLTAFDGMSVALASPTGMAAKRLSEATGRTATTIHRLLGYHPRLGWRRNAHNPLECDLLVLDEVSMVDVMLMSRLLDALRDTCRVVFVGDADQLPSVGPGRVLGDMIDSEVLPVVELTQIKRQGEGSRIVVNAHRVNKGAELEHPDPGAPSDFYLIRRETKEATAELVVQLVADRLPERFGFDPLKDIWVLTPQNVGPAGTVELNKVLQQRLNPDGVPVSFLKKKGLRVGDRVMQWKNNYDLNVFNGDSGKIVRFDAGSEELIIDVIGRGEVIYDKTAAFDLRLAYATTVHKSQGSEYPCVVLIMHKTHYRMLRRPLLYTGMTRARKLLVIVGQEEAIEVATRTSDGGKRHSGLGFRLAEREGDVLPPAPEGSEDDDLLMDTGP